MFSRRILLFVLVLFLLLGGGAGFVYWQLHMPRENQFDPLISSVARDAGVDPFLIRALIWRESRFNPSVHGTADERGLMQVTPDAGAIWAKSNKIPNFHPDDLYDPRTNVMAGTWYLNRSIKRWSQTDDPVSFALAEYNAGRSNALKWVDPTQPLNHEAFLERITFPTTRKYVDVILEQRDRYHKAFATSRWYRDFEVASKP